MREKKGLKIVLVFEEDLSKEDTKNMVKLFEGIAGLFGAALTIDAVEETK